MLGRSKSTNNNATKPYGEASGSSHNNIGYGTKIVGEITCDGDIRIDGHVKGSIKSKAKVVIGESGMVEGDVICDTGVVSGQINGTITSNDSLTLKTTATVDGDIISAKFIVEEGAKFNGKCQMNTSVSSDLMLGSSKENKKVDEKKPQLQEQD